MQLKKLTSNLEGLDATVSSGKRRREDKAIRKKAK